jgi:hypothetical protein
LPAYYLDCGWDGLPCVTRGRPCSAHPGDSELIVVEVRHDGATRRWVAQGVFLSAHCFGRSAGRCRWYDGDELAGFTWRLGVRRGAPRVWVAKGKHAHYPSARECDTGHWYYDSCDGNDVVYRFPITSSVQNIGSRRRPLPGTGTTAGCVAGAGARTGTIECFWDPSRRFEGWQRARLGAGATSYARVLAAVGF